jgi:hypothetical protein
MGKTHVGGGPWANTWSEKSETSNNNYGHKHRGKRDKSVNALTQGCHSLQQELRQLSDASVSLEYLDIGIPGVRQLPSQGTKRIHTLCERIVSSMTDISIEELQPRVRGYLPTANHHPWM